ncbi:hypothetical protein BA898_07480 [Spiribacter roseus]|nr:hypothetical protein BBH56_05645 [Spiribacter roseus]KAF0281069.1 hypothetical protein BA900_00560 [Spiribacter roseus]KAF0284187.1 hypothetical protein BA898_07480 [Spiribacter roseus]
MNLALHALCNHLLRPRYTIRIRAGFQADHSFDLARRHIQSTYCSRCVFSAAEIPDIVAARLKLRDIHLGNAKVPNNASLLNTYNSATGRVHLYSNRNVIRDANVMPVGQLPWRPADIGSKFNQSSA